MNFFAIFLYDVNCYLSYQNNLKKTKINFISQNLPEYPQNKIQVIPKFLSRFAIIILLKKTWIFSLICLSSNCYFQKYFRW